MAAAAGTGDATDSAKDGKMNKGRIIMWKFRLLMLAVLVCLCGCKTGWEVERKVEPVKDLREHLEVVPELQKALHGDSERTQVLFNLLVVRSLYQDHEARVKILETKIDELKIRAELAEKVVNE